MQVMRAPRLTKVGPLALVAGLAIGDAHRMDFNGAPIEHLHNPIREHFGKWVTVRTAREEFRGRLVEVDPTWIMLRSLDETEIVLDRARLVAVELI
jgi:hypothetical protein